MNDMNPVFRPASHYARSQEGACQTMWASVIYRAVADAEGKNCPTPAEMRQARTWLDGGGRDFQTVCELAGLDPSSVHAAWKDGRLSYARLREAMTDEQRRKQRQRHERLRYIGKAEANG